MNRCLSRSLAAWFLFLSAAVPLIAAPAARLEIEADALWAKRNYTEAKRLYAQAAVQRLKEVDFILVEGKTKKSEEISFEAIEAFTPDEDTAFDSLLNSPAALGKSADNKAACYLAAARDFEMSDQLDKAGPCYDRAQQVPHQTEAGRLTVMQALANHHRLVGNYEQSVRLLTNALAMTQGADPLKDRHLPLMHALSDAHFTGRNFDAATDTQFAILALHPTGSNRFKTLKDYISDLTASNHTEAAIAACKRYLARDDANAFDRSWILLKHATIHRKRREPAAGLALAEEALTLGHDKIEAVREAFECRLMLPDQEAAWRWLAEMAGDEKAVEYGQDSRAKRAAWARDLMSYGGYAAYLRFRDDRAREARDFLVSRGIEPGYYAGCWLGTVKRFEDFRKFPLDEADITFPTSIADFGIADRKTVHVKDLYDGWNPTNMTAVLQEALDSGATTVILDKMEGPWYLSQVRPRSNQNIVFEKGVVVLADEDTKTQKVPKLYPDVDMFVLKNVTNVVFIGKGDKPEDVSIGKYKDYDERRKYCRDYGGCGFSVENSRNIAFLNLKVAECTMDGIVFGGLGGSAANIYVKDVILDSNYRQAASFCNLDGGYFKNVTFSNTRGNSPMCGIDIESSYELEANCGMYLFDCTFKGNVGSHLNFSASSYYPVTLHAKRCTFEPNPAGNVVVFARCGVYMQADVQAPSRILFEECTFNQHSEDAPLRIEQSSFFNVEFRNSRVVDAGPRQPGSQARGNPVLFKLSRFYGHPMTYDKQGRVVFDNLQINGYEGRPVIAFWDTVGTYSVTNIFGHAVHNGQKVDLSSFRYLAPETGLDNIVAFDPAAYGPPAAVPPAGASNAVPLRLGFIWGVPWFQPAPVYTAVYWDGKAWQTRTVASTWNNLGDLADKAVAFQGRSTESVYKIRAAKDYDGDTFYFEVPAGGRECRLRACGEMELKNPAGEVADAFRWGETPGVKYLTIKPTTDKAEIWSVRIRNGADLKFFAPLSGLIAEKPEWLPRAK